VTSVKNQAQCGSCTAFACTATLDACFFQVSSEKARLCFVVVVVVVIVAVTDANVFFNVVIAADVY